MTAGREPAIRVRACVAVVRDGSVLLVPHFDTDAGPTQWHLPGGAVGYGEALRAAAAREAREETGLDVELTGLLDVGEVVAPERGWHSVTVTYGALPRGGALAAEAGHRHGVKAPRWFTRSELTAVACHPRHVIEHALALAGA